MPALSHLPPDLLYIVAERYVAREDGLYLVTRAPWVVRLLLGPAHGGPDGTMYKLIADHLSISNVRRPDHPFYDAIPLLTSYQGCVKMLRLHNMGKSYNLLVGTPCTPQLLQNAFMGEDYLVVEARLATNPNLCASKLADGTRAGNRILVELVTYKWGSSWLPKMLERLLCEPSIDVNTWGGQGSSALHTAAYHNDTEVARVLLKNGADVNCRSVDGRTPLRSMNPPRSSDCAQLLRDAGGVVE